MNTSQLINDVKLLEALNDEMLPTNEPVEKWMTEILGVTVREWSQYKRDKEYSVVRIKDLEAVNENERKAGIFLLPKDLCTLNIISCHADFLAFDKGTFAQAKYINQSMYNAFNVYGTFAPQDIMSNQINAAAMSRYMSQTYRPFVSEYLGYNKIRLANYNEEMYITLTVERNHDNMGESIPDAQFIEFKKLFTLNIKIGLYNIYKKYNTIGGVNSKMQLPLDSYSSAESAKNELLESFNSTFYLDDLIDLVTFF